MSLIYIPLGYLLEFCYNIFGKYANYGFALILFTIITKIITYPLAIKQQKGSIEMARMKPKLDALNKKYGKDKAKLNEETQKLYEEEKYSPLSGCLPMLIQLPILFGLFGVIREPLKYMLHIDKTVLANAMTNLQTLIDNKTVLIDVGKKASEIGIKTNFAQLKDLVPFTPDDISKITNLNLNFGFLDLAGTPSLKVFNLLWIIPIFAGVTAFLSSWVSQKTNPAAATQSSMMSMMLYGMPLISVMFAFSMQAGIGFYWGISNLLIVAQTLMLYQFYNMHKINALSHAALAAKRIEYENDIKKRIAGEHKPKT